MDSLDTFVLDVQWFDRTANVIRDFLLTYYVRDKNTNNELSLYDKKNRKVFLKRGPVENVEVEDLFVGSLITVYSRQLKIVSYGNASTRDAFEKDRGRVVTIVPPEAYRQAGDIISAASSNQFTISKLKTIMQPTGDMAVAVELIGADAVQSWSQVLSRNFGRSFDTVGADSATDELFAKSAGTATFDCCSLCIIKPHAFKAGNSGAVVDSLIKANFEVSAMQLFTLVRKEAENFYEVYKTVVSAREFTEMVAELSAGPCLAIEVRAENCVSELRKLCGPRNVDIATALRPTTLRARFGKSTIENAVHCTDLEDDGKLESEFFFRVLSS